jgi:hypothetical protein
MCHICKNPRTRAQARARDRLQKAERERFQRKGRNFKSLLERKCFSPDTGLIAHGEHHEGFIEYGNFHKFPDSPKWEGEETQSLAVKEKNLYYYHKGLGFIYFPWRQFYYCLPHRRNEVGCRDICYASKTIFINPREEDLALLRRIATEVPI